MPIKITLEKNLYVPLVFCDHCGQQIEDAGKANYEWLVGEGGTPVDGVIHFVHKECCRAFEASHSGQGSWYWGGLSNLMVYLIHNLKVNYAKAREDVLTFGI